MSTTGVFEIKSPDQFLSSIEEVFARYKKGKESADILYVTMGLNHLREWIAPRYKPGKAVGSGNPKDPAEKFSDEIYFDPDFRLIRNLVNHTKHMTKKLITDVKYGVKMSDWPNLTSVHSLAQGATLQLIVEDQGKQIDVATLCESVIDSYKSKWFNK